MISLTHFSEEGTSCRREGGSREESGWGKGKMTKRGKVVLVDRAK